jgi:hypothetical protein
MIDDLDRISFAEWLIDLNACAVRAGYKGAPLVIMTGQLEWHHYYEDGMTPAAALDAAATDGAMFEREYAE